MVGVDEENDLLRRKFAADKAMAMRLDPKLRVNMAPQIKGFLRSRFGINTDVTEKMYPSRGTHFIYYSAYCIALVFLVMGFFGALFYRNTQDATAIHIFDFSMFRFGGEMQVKAGKTYYQFGLQELGRYFTSNLTDFRADATSFERTIWRYDECSGVDEGEEEDLYVHHGGDGDGGGSSKDIELESGLCSVCDESGLGSTIVFSIAILSAIILPYLGGRFFDKDYISTVGTDEWYWRSIARVTAPCLTAFFTMVGLLHIQ